MHKLLIISLCLIGFSTGFACADNLVSRTVPANETAITVYEDGVDITDKCGVLIQSHQVTVTWEVDDGS